VWGWTQNSNVRCFSAYCKAHSDLNIYIFAGIMICYLIFKCLLYLSVTVKFKICLSKYVSYFSSCKHFSWMNVILFVQCAMLEAWRFYYSAFDTTIIEPLLLATCFSWYCAGFLNMKIVFFF
jgi:hypothetical protein